MGDGGLTSTINLNAGIISSSQDTVSLLTTTDTSIAFGTTATTVTVGQGASGTINLNAETIESNQATVALLNGTPTTINFGGAATTISMGASTLATTINLNAGVIDSDQATVELLNHNPVDTIHFGTEAAVINMGQAGTSMVTVQDRLTVGDIPDFGSCPSVLLTHDAGVIKQRSISDLRDNCDLKGEKGDKGEKGLKGDKGEKGLKGDNTADKHAIVEGIGSDRFVGLTCVEMPEVRFEDVITIYTNNRLSLSHKIDEEFIHVCEENSIDAIGYTTSSPCLCGIEVQEEYLNIKFSGSIPEKVTVKLSGIRQGRRGSRFPVFTQEQMDQNTNFWSSWRKD